ncbi:MAG: efflux RND transporter periplasmic adaptor subunit [Thermoanaerobaculia bacterium]
MSRTMKLLLPLAVVAAAVVVAVLLVQAAPEPPEREPETRLPLVRAVPAEPRDVRLDVHSQGTVRPRTRATLVAQVGGRIVEVSPSFAEGGVFRQGEVLVRIDPRDYELALSQARSQVAQAELRLAREEAESQVAREEWEELARDRAPADDRDGGASPLTLREPQLAEARAGLEAARSAVDKARLDLERTSVEAPFPGRVEAKQADLGQSVSPGTPLATVYAIDYAEIRLPVQVSELGYLDLDLAPGGGDDPSGSVDSGPEVLLSAQLGGGRHTWRGRIVRTAGGIDPETRMLPVIARVDRPFGEAAREAGAPLPVGLFVEARIAGREAEGVYVLPRSAMRRTGRWREGELGAVLVAESASGDEPARLRFRDVRILRVVGDEAVVSAGLEPGDLVVVSPLETPTDGMPVRVERIEPGEVPEAPAGPGDLPDDELTIEAPESSP